MNKVDFLINLGTDWIQPVVIKDQYGQNLNLVSYSIISKFKKHYTSKTFITINTSSNNGVLNLSLPAGSTANVAEGRYEYDVVITDVSNNHSKILEGIITLLTTISK